MNLLQNIIFCKHYNVSVLRRRPVMKLWLAWIYRHYISYKVNFLFNVYIGQYAFKSQCIFLVAAAKKQTKKSHSKKEYIFIVIILKMFILKCVLFGL